MASDGHRRWRRTRRNQYQQRLSDRVPVSCFVILSSVSVFIRNDWITCTSRRVCTRPAWVRRYTVRPRPSVCSFVRCILSARIDGFFYSTARITIFIISSSFHSIRTVVVVTTWRMRATVVFRFRFPDNSGSAAACGHIGFSDVRPTIT